MPWHRSTNPLLSAHETNAGNTPYVCHACAIRFMDSGGLEAIGAGAPVCPRCHSADLVEDVGQAYMEAAAPLLTLGDALDGLTGGGGGGPQPGGGRNGPQPMLGNGRGGGGGLGLGLDGVGAVERLLPGLSLIPI